VQNSHCKQGIIYLSLFSDYNKICSARQVLQFHFFALLFRIDIRSEVSYSLSESRQRRVVVSFGKYLQRVALVARLVGYLP